jgi:ribosomal protein S18 acetylase RimI-like enzyme
MRVTIEPALRPDAEAILVLQKLAYQSEAALYDDYDIPPLRQTLEEIEAEFADHVFLKALTSGELVGSVRARQAGEVCEVGRLIVDPAHQGRGIGRLLMRAIEERFEGVRWFELFTGHRSERNLRLYRGLGYVDVREEPVSPVLTLVYLRKEPSG